MARVDKKAEKGPMTDFIVTSIGACVAETTDKKKPPCLVIAYATGNSEVFFVFADMPQKNKLYTKDNLLAFVAKAEGVKNVTYVGYDGQPKDIYLCRADGGTITDIVERDYENNHFTDGFAEVQTAMVKFSVTSTGEYAKKFGKKHSITLSALSAAEYTKDSYEYAIVNAYNACLLGKVLEREELQIETKRKKRVKFEVRNVSAAFVEQTVLYIRPVCRQSGDFVDYYQTEEFNYIDGEDVSCRSYKIIYSNRLNDYNIIRM